MSKPDGGPAFPRRLPNIKVPPEEAWEVIKAHAGMSMRDWFAGLALHGLLRDAPAGTYFTEIADEAYQTADAMLKERDHA